MGSVTENVCCQEIPRVMEELDQVENTSNAERPACILDHPGFAVVCLNRWVLETAWLQYRTEYKEPYEGPLFKRYRHIAYRQLVRMVWKYLGKHIRVPLPACAVKVIRTTYPAPENEDYVGFRLADLD